MVFHDELDFVEIEHLMIVVIFICLQFKGRKIEEFPVNLFRRYVKAAVKAANGKCLVYPGIACRSSHIIFSFLS